MQRWPRRDTRPQTILQDQVAPRGQVVQFLWTALEELKVLKNANRERLPPVPEYAIETRRNSRPSHPRKKKVIFLSTLPYRMCRQTLISCSLLAYLPRATHVLPCLCRRCVARDYNITASCIKSQ